MNEWRSQPLISIILVNWNGANDLPRCLDSIFRQTYRSIEVIVVDNGSTDDSLDLLRKYPDLILLRNETNRGFSMANNQAIARAGGDWIFLLNVDAWMAPDCLHRLMERVLQEEPIGSARSQSLPGAGKNPGLDRHTAPERAIQPGGPRGKSG
jgi:GT2 family glycosyltransferase